jgi:hypothetical protein
MPYSTSVFSDAVITPSDLPKLQVSQPDLRYHSFHHMNRNKKHFTDIVKFQIDYSLTLGKFSGTRAINLT